MTHGHDNIKELKTKFKADFDKVRDFVNVFDPCGLISGGAPDDEYDCLTSHLLSGLYAKKSRQDFKEIILHEIEHHFGTPDISSLTEPYKTNFYKDLDALLDNMDGLKPSH